MTTSTTAEQVNAVLREFGQAQSVDVVDIGNRVFLAKDSVQTLVHNMAQGILNARATIARLEAANHDLEAAVHTYRKSADAANGRVEAMTGGAAVKAALEVLSRKIISRKLDWAITRDALSAAITATSVAKSG